MRSDASLDSEIKTLEQRIRDRRIALHAAMHDLSSSASDVKQRVRDRAATPAIIGVALVMGFFAARAIRRARTPRRKLQRRLEGWRDAWRREEKPSTGRQVTAAVLSAALPIALRLAQRQAIPLIERAMRAYSRRGTADRYGAGY